MEPSVNNDLIEAKRTLDERGEKPPDDYKRPDFEKLAKPKVTVQRVPLRFNPLKKGMAFQFNGAVYEVYEVKSRGRMLIRFLGLATVPEDKEETEKL